MSLSEAPSVKITINTPRDVSDELLGGTISFCEEVGYKQNIMIITFLWSGFLLSSRSQLDEHNLIEKVLNCYTQSLGNLFPKLRGDENLKKQVSEMLQHYWNNLNLDFDDMKDEEEISKFLQIVNKLNSQDDTSSAYLLNKDPYESFEKMVSALNSNIYRILYQIDNGFSIEYRGIVKYPFLSQQTNTVRPTSQVHSTSATNSKVITKTKKVLFLGG